MVSTEWSAAEEQESFHQIAADRQAELERLRAAEQDAPVEGSPDRLVLEAWIARIEDTSLR